MGLISKQIRKSTNQKLAAPLSVTTTLMPDQVVAAITAICDNHNAALVERATPGSEGAFSRLVGEARSAVIPQRSYYVATNDKDILVSYSMPVARVIALGARKPKFTDGYWLARIGVFRNDSDPSGSTRRVQISLLKWVINQDGKLQNKRKYEELTELVLAAVASTPARVV